MATKPLTHEEIAHTEKKLDMPLDEIIKMSKNRSKSRELRRAPNKSQKIFKNSTELKALKASNYMNSRPLIRQAFLAGRRSNFQDNQFSVTSKAAKKSAFLFRGQNYRSAPTNSNRRNASSVLQQQAANGKYMKVSERQMLQDEQQSNGTNQKRQTLDSLFANLKQQRMKAMSRQSNIMLRRDMIPRRSRAAPWVRGRF